LRTWPLLRWRVAILLCLVTTVNYIDRQALSVTAPVLMDEFSISNVEYGWITSAFLFAYAVGQLLSGPVIDRLGSKPAFSLAVGLWSVAGMAHALARGVGGFIVCRVFLGLLEAANFPAALKVIAEWFPTKDRAMAVGILTVGPGLGAILAPPLIGYLTYAFGWQWAFIIAGAVGFLWLALWLWMYALPEAHPHIGADEQALILSGRNPEPASRLRISRLLLRREMWGLMLARFTADGSFYFFVFWLPNYLASQRGFDILQIGLIAWVPFLAADLGSLAGGYTNTWLMGRGVSLDRARKTVIWLGALLVPLGVPAIFVDSSVTAIALIAAAMFATQFKAASLFALPADMFAARDVAKIWGIFGAAGSFGAILFAPFIGWMIDEWSYTPVFVCAALMHIVSALCITLFVPHIEPQTGTEA
jgi:ACS family hexuronate transporter-like MFS transporter